MKFEKFKRLIRTDFEEQFQNLIDKLGFALNNTIETIIEGLNHKISLQDNILCTVKTVTTSVDANGNPITPLFFQLTITNKPLGIISLNTLNLTNNTSYGTTGVTIYWSLSGTVVNINNITGLVAGNSYQLTLVAFG